MFNDADSLSRASLPPLPPSRPVLFFFFFFSLSDPEGAPVMASVLQARDAPRLQGEVGFKGVATRPSVPAGCRCAAVCAAAMLNLPLSAVHSRA